jgi:hypothetical protein
VFLFHFLSENRKCGYFSRALPPCILREREGQRVRKWLAGAYGLVIIWSGRLVDVSNRKGIPPSGQTDRAV